MMQHYSARVFWSQEDQGYIAVAPEFPGVSAFGEAAADALNELESLLPDVIDHYQREGWPLPAPRPAEEFSGQLRLRLPRSLHRDLVWRAEEEGSSLNKLLVAYISRGLGEAGSLAEFDRRVRATRTG